MGRSPGDKLQIPIRREYLNVTRITNPQMSGDKPIETNLTEKGKIVYRHLLF